MTNAEYYLRDGVSKDKFIYEIVKLFANWGEEEQKEYLSLTSYVTEWVNKTIKPTLTEDERVILRNIDMSAYQKITRDETYALILFGKDDEDEQIFRCDFDCYSHLFSFIKERRRILY